MLKLEDNGNVRLTRSDALELLDHLHLSPHTDKPEYTERLKALVCRRLNLSMDYFVQVEEDHMGGMTFISHKHSMREYEKAQEDYLKNLKAQAEKEWEDSKRCVHPGHRPNEEKAEDDMALGSIGKPVIPPYGSPIKEDKMEKDDRIPGYKIMRRLKLMLLVQLIVPVYWLFAPVIKSHVSPYWSSISGYTEAQCDSGLDGIVVGIHMVLFILTAMFMCAYGNPSDRVNWDIKKKPCKRCSK